MKNWKKALAIACGVVTMLPQAMGLVPMAEAKMVSTPHMGVTEVDDRLPWGKSPGRLMGEISEPDKYASPELRRVVEECSRDLKEDYAAFFYLLRGVDANGNGTVIRNDTLMERVNYKHGTMALSAATVNIISILDEFAGQNANKPQRDELFNAARWLCMAFAPMPRAYIGLMPTEGTAPIYQGRFDLFKQINTAK